MIEGDELAGVVDQFGALTRDELARAVEEVAFKRGEDLDRERLDAAVDRALADLRLVAVERGGEELLAPGPTAFPALPEGAGDLPHILEVTPRTVERAALVEPAERRLREAAARAVAAGDDDRVADLLDATYDLEAWAPGADASGVRDRLDAALDAGEDPGDR
ncbi:MAG: hypothetical protein ABEJ61_06565 [Haloferacaceae archaeon]